MSALYQVTRLNLDLNSTRSLKQQSTGRLAVFSDIKSRFRNNQNLLLRVISDEATNTNFIVFYLIRTNLERTIYRTRGSNSNHYTTDAVKTNIDQWLIITYHNLCQ